MSSRNRESKKEKMKTSLITADSLEKVVKIFNKMEESRFFTQDELDVFCTPIAGKLYVNGKHPEKFISFGKRSLKSMVSQVGNVKTNNQKIPCKGGEDIDLEYFLVGVDGIISSIDSDVNHYVLDLMLPTFLIMLASVCCDLKRFNESISYYNWAQRNLTNLLEKEKDCPYGCFSRKLERANLGLFVAKASIGRNEEAISHLKKVLECKEKRLEEGCVEIGEANKHVYEAYFDVDDFKEALPYGLKALEIHRKHFGGESVEVAEMLKSLGGIYVCLEEYEQSLEQNRLAKSILEKMAPDSLLLLEMGLVDGFTLRELGRYKEAFEVYKSVLADTGASEVDRARAFSGMAYASLGLKKLTDTKKYIKAAQQIYQKKEINALSAAEGFDDFSRMYETMNDLETSISFLRRVLEIPKLPKKLLWDSCLRLFSLYSLAGKEEEGIPYMEAAVEKLKESFGLGQYEVGRGYEMLGQIYVTLAQDELGLKVMEKAKEIFDAYRGPDHLDSLYTSHNLALIYSRLQRIELAMKTEEDVVAHCKGLGQSGEEVMIMKEAVQLLNKLKELSMDSH